MSTTIKEFEAGTITEFIQIIEEECLSEYILFRGQSEEWDLLPRIARINPRNGLSILKAEIDMIEDFKRLSRPFLKTVPSNMWEWLSNAQHFGMSTRLLDWSTNPLTALWFTVQNPSTQKDGVVWLFKVPEQDIIKSREVETLDPFNQKRTKVYQPEIISERIQSQNAWFTLHKYLIDEDNFIPFQKNKAYKKYLTKIIIPQDEFAVIRYQLERLGINKLSLFPDLEGAALHAEWKNAYKEDEEGI